jgi:hypothetical protein
VSYTDLLEFVKEFINTVGSPLLTPSNDEIEDKFSNVKIIIPTNIYSINPSFFEELFFNVVNKLGKELFLSKFEFSNLGEYNFEKPLNEAIERILRTQTAIG